MGLVCLVAAAYGQTLGFDLVWDDHVIVVRNPALGDEVTWRQVFATSRYLAPMPGAERMYRPLLIVTAAADRAIWGMRPGGFHLSSALAHLAIVILLWRLAWRMTGSLPTAFAAGALLAVHPSAVEAVTFVAARMDLFVGLGIAAVFLLLRGSLGPGGGLRLAGALFCFAFALGSKETAAAIPAMVTWAAWVYPEWFAGLRPVPGRAALAARVASFWVVLGGYAALRQAVIGSLTPLQVGLAEMPAQALRALAALATYGEMILISRPVSPYILVGPPAGPGDGRVILGLAMVGLLVAALLWLRHHCPPAGLALGCSAAALVPTSNLLPIYQGFSVYVAERSLYPALVGWCLFVAVGVHAFRWREREECGRSWVFAGMGGAVLVTFLLVAFVKSGAWRDEVTLWSAAVVSEPGHLETRSNLVIALAQAGDLEGAQTAVREAAGLFPEDPRISYLAGRVAESRGDLAEAMRQYERVMALGARLAPAYRQAALLSARLQEWGRAGRWFAAAADLFPTAAWPHVGLGWSQARQGRADLAQAHYDRATRLEPKSPDRPWFLGQLLAAEGRTVEAIQAFQATLALDPSFLPARRALALSFEREGRVAEARDQWRRIAADLPGSHRTEAQQHLRRLEAAAEGQPPPGGR